MVPTDDFKKKKFKGHTNLPIAESEGPGNRKRSRWSQCLKVMSFEI